MVSGMPNPISNRVRGELLREWRFSQEWDVVDLARRVNLSIGQIQQLETGGTSLFYSEAIRENAARKVAAMLGADPQMVIRMDDEAAVTGSELNVVDDLVELSRQRAQAAQQPPFVVRHASLIFTGLVSLAGLMTAANWLQQKWQNGGAQQFWRGAAVTAPVPALAPPEPATDPAQMTQVPAASALGDAASPKAEPAPVAATAAAHAAAVSAPAVLAAQLPAHGVPPVPVNNAAVASSAAVATAPTAVASANKHPLCQQASTGHALTPTRPSKAGDMVYIVAQKVGSVCVVDASGVHTVLSLKPQEARSVYGAAPWRVNFELPEQAQLYFQGERLRVPGASVTTVALREASLAP